ncbi:helix-turn-helix domain-containing protein [Bradyrhizobium brasilense]|uniref:helix-turn-helix domain-containing protein n=1 Tax=Bradyrhizobium brasilense TaxID=1419277 RepID=UPI0035C69913
MSIAEAARILGYSGSTIRSMLADGGLQAMRVTRGGPLLVTVESLTKLIEGAEPVPAEAVQARRASEPVQLAVIQGGRK